MSKQPPTTKDLTWRAMKDRLNNATEREALAMLHDEQRGPNRQNWLVRIYGRYSVLREQREREQMTSGVILK